MRLYTITEINAIESLLRTVPRGTSGMLPFDDFKSSSEWALLIKNHSEGSIKAKLNKMWKNSIIPVVPKEKAQPAIPAALNHAYNFCPNCGMNLNK